MSKSFPHYRQSTMETCGVACLLMALDRFVGLFDRYDYLSSAEKQALAAALEEEYYRDYGAKAAKGTLGAAIAYALSQRRLDVTLIHESRHLLENRPLEDGGAPYFSEDLYQKLLAEHRSWIKKANGAFAVEAGTPVTAGRLRSELDANRAVITQILIDGDADGIHDRVLHWIVVYDYKGDTFRICDPLKQQRSSLSSAELEQYMVSPLGGCCIAVGRRRSVSPFFI